MQSRHLVTAISLALVLNTSGFCGVWAAGKKTPGAEPTTPIANWDRFKIDVIFALNRKQFERAEAMCDEALKRYPNNASARLSKGRVYLWQRNYQAALSELNKAQAIDGNSDDIWFAIGDAKEGLGDLEGALTAFQKCSKSDPETAAIRAAKLFAYKDDPRALKYLDQALKLVPQEPMLRFERSIIYWKMGNFRKAIDDCEVSCSVEPRESAYCIVLGSYYYSNGDYLKAIAKLDKGIELDPRNAATFLQRAMAKEDSGDDIGAESDYRSFFAGGGTKKGALLRLAELQYRNKMIPEARESLEKYMSVSSDPGYRAYKLLANIKSSEGDICGSLNVWAKAVRANIQGQD